VAYSTGPTVEGRGEGGKLGEKGVKVMKSVNWEFPMCSSERNKSGGFGSNYAGETHILGF